MELLTTVNDFYDKAFTRLLVTAFGVTAFIGVIVPIAVGWLQMRSLRSEKTSLLNELRAELSSEREGMEARIKEEVETQVKIIKDEYEERFTKITKEIRKSSASSLARAHHLQGKAALNNSEAAFGAPDLFHAAAIFFEAGEEANARRTIVFLSEDCLPKVCSEHYKEFELEKCCETLISEIEKHNENSRYDDDIALIRRDVQRASMRSNKSTNAK